MKIYTWIVMEKDNKITAIKYAQDSFHKQTNELKKKGYKILGYPVAKTKQRAIDYIQEIID